MHVHTNTCTHNTCVHTHAHTLTHTFTYLCTPHTHTHTHTHTHIHHSHTHIHTYIHTLHSHTHIHVHTDIHTQVVLDFQYIPHYEQDTVAGTDRSEESTLSTSPAATIEGENQSGPFDTSSHRYANGESRLNDTLDASHDVERELSHHGSREEGLHLDASQDPELVVNPSWPSGSSQVGNSELETVVSAETLGVSEWKSVIGASLSEPHTSELDGRFFI